MDINEYALEHMVRERLATLRADAARRHVAAVPAATGPGLRARVGSALIHAGEWLRAGTDDAAPSHSSHG
jgi:hypothetical protein